MCSSDFIKERWLNLLFATFHRHTRSSIDAFTYSGTAFGYFQAMSIMCNVARQTVIDARDLFLGTSVVSSQIPNLELFQLSINSTFEDFQLSLSNSFIHNLQLFRGLSQSSSLVDRKKSGRLLLISHLKLIQTSSRKELRVVSYLSHKS